MNNTCLIHNNNIGYVDYFDEEIKFSLGTVDIDKYISQNIIPKIKDKNPSIVYIKDNLSSNYLELYGLRVAYHIRLSNELSFTQRCLPIVMISDVGTHVLNKLSVISNILYTKNIFTIKNNINLILEFNTEKIISFKSENEYQDKFLNKIEIKPPKESSHDIANEWAIFKWAKELQISSSTDINATISNISYQLYFKYLNQNNDLKEDVCIPEEKEAIQQVRHPILDENEITELLTPTEKGKILFIDDEWEKGWNDILSTLFGNRLETFKHSYKDVDEEELFSKIEREVKKHDPAIVILDLRLVQTDHNEKIKLNDFTGIKILNRIHKINAGIQVIMLSATSKSTILEKLYDYKILGYIKKEHPNDITISTQENIEKLITLVKDGFKNSYLKKIWIIRTYILDELNADPFLKYGINFPKEDNENEVNYLELLKNNVIYIFDILNTKMINRYNYAMVSIATSLETIVKIFLYEKVRNEHLYFWDNKPVRALNDISKLEDKILKIVEDRFGCSEKISLDKLINYRNNYMHSNKNKKIITEVDILNWCETYKKIISSICKPVKYKKFDADKKNVKKHHNFAKK